MFVDPEVLSMKNKMSGFNPLKRQPHKIFKHPQKICRITADKLFECVCGVGTWRVSQVSRFALGYPTNWTVLEAPFKKPSWQWIENGMKNFTDIIFMWVII